MSKEVYYLDDLVYSSRFSNEEVEFKIIQSQVRMKPQFLYKYATLSENSVDALTHLYIYASHPEQLNDPLDCWKNIIEIDNLNDVKTLWGGNYQKFNNTYKDAKAQIAISNDAFRTLFYRKCGILSLTSEKDNEQMWTLYAQNSGFRLEFDVTCFPFSFKGPFPIYYRSHLPHIKTSECNIATAALVQTNIKHTCWNYENEWRLIVYNSEGFDMKAFGPYSEWVNQPDDHDRKYRYPLRALKSISLGCDFFKDAQLEHRLFVVGDSEMNVVYNAECLQTLVLDFLSEVQTKYPLKVCLVTKAPNGAYEETSVLVIKLSACTYHFVEID